MLLTMTENEKSLRELIDFILSVDQRYFAVKEFQDHDRSWAIMLEETIKNARRMSIFESATTESAEPKTLPLIVENNGRHEVRILRLGDTGLEETIQHTSKGEPVLIDRSGDSICEFVEASTFSTRNSSRHHDDRSIQSTFKSLN